MNRRVLSDRRRSPDGTVRLFKIGIRVTAEELERIRVVAAKEGMRAGTWVQRVAVDAAVRAA